MIKSNLNLHFETPEIYSGFGECNGIIRVKEEGLMLEYQVKDGIVGFLKSSPKFLLIPYEELTDIQYKFNLFRSRFHLYVDNIKLLNKFPYNKEGVITLKVKRSQKGTAKKITHEVRLIMSNLGESGLSEGFTLIS